VSGYVLGVGRKLVALRKAWLYDLRRSVATGPGAGILGRLVCYTGRCRFIRQMEGESCLT